MDEDPDRREGLTYIIICDEDSHWYVIPSDKWNGFNVLIDEYDDGYPSWAVRINGPVSSVKFKEYTIGC